MSIFPTLRSPRVAALATASALALAGCSGGGSSESDLIQPLTVAGSMSVVTTSSGGPAASIAPHAQADTSGFSPTCDYNTDRAHSYVYDPSMEPLGTVNMILCLLKQTAYSGLLNEGLYKAQIDEMSCETGKGGDSASGQGHSNAVEVDFNVWVVHSSRPSNTGAQELEFWIPPKEDDRGDIRVHVEVTKGVSDENPFGVFDLNYIQFESDDTTIRGLGNLHTLDAAAGFAGFSFYQEEGDVDVVQPEGESASRVQANVLMSADQTNGAARIQLSRRETFSGGSDTGILVNAYNVVYDETHVVRETNSDGGVCLSRTDFDTRTWRYNLYDAKTGDRIELNSGFGFKTQDGTYGWAGYWGVWLPEGVQLPDGATITRSTYGQSVPETYTLLKARGKLIQNTRRQIPLSDIQGVDFEFWYDEVDGKGFHTFHRWQLEYEEGAWYAKKSWDDKAQDWVDLKAPLLIDTLQYGVLGMWSPGLGGPCSYVHGDGFVTYYERELVGPSHPLIADLTYVDLYGYDRCLRASITSAEATLGDIYFPAQTNVASPYTYRLIGGEMTFLTSDGRGLLEVGLGDAQAPTSGPYMWGMSSGPLVTGSVAASLASTYDIYDVDVFYTYETGHNPWNQLQVLFDANENAVVFDEPIQFSYVHATGDDANGDTTYDGRTYLLGYDGPGELHGLPYSGIDLDGDSQPDRFYPQFSIRSGTLCGPKGTEFVIRAIESEQTLRLDVGNCGTLPGDLATAAGLTLPTSDDWTDPALGTMPDLDAAPRVIKGEIVGGGS